MKRDRVIFAIDVGGNENATLQLSIRRKKKIEKEREEEYIILELPRRKFVNSFRFPYSPLPLLLSLSKNKWMSRTYDRWMVGGCIEEKSKFIKDMDRGRETRERIEGGRERIYRVGG